MPYTIYLEAKITDDDTSNEVVTLSRFYEVQSLSKVGEVAAHFGKSAGVLVEGVELGMDPNS